MVETTIKGQNIDTTDTNLFVTISSGVGDEGKIPLLDANGKLDASTVTYYDYGYANAYTVNTTSQTNTSGQVTTNGTPVEFILPQTILVELYSGHNDGSGDTVAKFQYSLDGNTGWTDIASNTTTGSSSYVTKYFLYNVNAGIFLRGVCSGQYTGSADVYIRYQ